MVWTDTHAHLYSDEFLADQQEMIARALEAGVTTLLLPNIDESSITGMLKLEGAYPKNCFAMMGLHPCYVKQDVENQLRLIKDWLIHRPFKAIGEIGLDFYWDKSLLEQQYQEHVTGWDFYLPRLPAYAAKVEAGGQA